MNDVYIKGMMTKQELSDFLPDHPTLKYIQQLVFHKKIPCHKSGPYKNSKVYFIKADIILWMGTGKPNCEEFEKIKKNIK